MTKDGVCKEILQAAQSALLMELVLPCVDATERLRMLLAEDAIPDLLEHQSEWLMTTAVHLAARTGQACWIKAFADLGFDLDRKDADEKTPAVLAVINQRTDVLQALHEAGVNVAGEYHGPGQGTLLMDAVALPESTAVCELLLRLGVDVNATDAHGNTAAHLAVENLENMLVLLTAHEVDLSRGNAKGDSVAHVACQLGDPLVIVHLLDRDVEFDSTNSENVTPRDILSAADGTVLTDVVRSALAAHAARQALSDMGMCLHERPSWQA